MQPLRPGGSHREGHRGPTGKHAADAGPDLELMLTHPGYRREPKYGESAVVRYRHGIARQAQSHRATQRERHLPLRRAPTRHANAHDRRDAGAGGDFRSDGNGGHRRRWCERERRRRAPALAGRGTRDDLASSADAAQIGPVALRWMESQATAPHDIRDFGLREERIRQQPDEFGFVEPWRCLTSGGSGERRERERG